MPHVSQKRVKKQVFNRMSNEFVNAIASMKNSSEVRGFLNELLTPTERVMLAKRLAVILMLKKKYSFLMIRHILKVSPSTVARISLQYEKGAYSKLLIEIKKQNSFWSELSKIIPPRAGRNRFKNFLQFS